jgi:hypothetical protein
VHTQPVQGARLQARDVTVVEVPGPLEQIGALERALFRVVQPDFDPRGDAGEHREVHSATIERRAARVTRIAISQ